ncbi:DUF6099 family protein [Streptomyces sp. JJ36]|uniref:DUF6099 family protein n=1 Tax=Streptomyces sp. JJ36 TaxID=2736645 RepID=UPI001F4391DB|nr:DUF6099 family protein [Streptomyces sp. JJ36]MCF6522682.1 hypothetical protein [Streptomyces sp. JJ36]
MEAVLLIDATRRAVARSRTVRAVIAEAWQAQALVEAVGTLLATDGPPAVRPEALSLREAGRRGSRPYHHEWQAVPGGLRASRLSLIRDARCTLVALSRLLGETGVALVGVAVAAEEEGLYWQCIEAIDAVDEAGDRVAGVLRGMALPERGPAV